MVLNIVSVYEYRTIPEMFSLPEAFMSKCHPRMLVLLLVTVLLKIHTPDAFCFNFNHIINVKPILYFSSKPTSF